MPQTVPGSAGGKPVAAAAVVMKGGGPPSSPRLSHQGLGMSNTEAPKSGEQTGPGKNLFFKALKKLSRRIKTC